MQNIACILDTVCILDSAGNLEIVSKIACILEII